MIITLTGADFSRRNIGILNGYAINKSLAEGVYCDSDATTVKIGNSYTANFTIAQGYIYHSSKIMMGETDITSNLTWNNAEHTSATLYIDSVVADLTIVIAASVVLNSDNTTVKDPDHHLNSTQVLGEAVKLSSQGTRGIYIWDIPANAIVTLQVSGGGNYGMALTDIDDNVLEWTANSTVLANNPDGVYNFAPRTYETKLHVSTTKFVSASYRIITEDEFREYDYPLIVTLNSDTTKYVSASQTIGSDVAFSPMSSTGYYVSEVIPANTQLVINVVSGGSYGMALCDTNGKVLEAKTNAQAGGDLLLTFAPQSVESVLYASKTKFVSATWSYV